MIYRCTQGSTVTVDTEVILNRKLSAEARLILIILLSHDDNYRFTLEQTVKESGLSKYKVEKALKELKNNRYLQYKHVSTSTGRFDGVEWIITENPKSKVTAKSVSNKVPSDTPEIITPQQFKFEQFWEKYPKKSNYDKARKEFFSLPDIDTVFPQIMDALDVQIQSKQWNEEQGRYIPNPENYLKKQSWNNVVVKKCTEEDLQELWEALQK